MTSQIFDDILIGSSAVSITDDALVTANAVIGLADGVFDVGMTATGSGHVIEVLGAIYGSVTSLIMGANASAFSDNQLIVGSTGMLFTTGDGVLILGGQSSVDNAGAINGESGIILHAVSGATTSTITNTGSIISHSTTNTGNAGIVHVGSETLVVVNTGLIRGLQSFRATSATSSDQITNSGLMVGDILLGAGNDLYDGRLGRISGEVQGGAGDDILRGGDGGETLDGGDGADTIDGNGGTDTLVGGDGADTLDGGVGADTLDGGTGDDIYVVDNAGDVVIEAAAAGTDTVQSSISLTLGDELEKLVLVGSAAIDGTGNSLGNTLSGNSGNNTLDGGTGADAMEGGSGSDTYVVDNAGDVVIEAVNAGTDTVRSSISLTLGANLENLSLFSTANLNGTGNDLANLLTGNSGNNVLNGRAGADTMAGLAGNDTYVVDSLSDVVVETVGNGTDTVQTAVNWTLGDNFENLTLLGAGNINGTGNSVANVMTGNSGNNVLNGRGGADTMTGLAGNDTYVVDSIADQVVEAVGGGTDTVQTAVSLTLAENVENLFLLGAGNINGVGNTLDNAITGNSGNNTLNGAAGDDTLIGGAGNDRLFGGFGNDDLTGGAGTDTFIFHSAPNAVTNVDTITDFSVADDTISLENSVFTTIGAVGTLAASAFVRNTTGLAQDASDRIIYESDTGNLFYDSNGNAAGGSVLIAVLDPGLLMTNLDFTVM
ncbi:MAG: calcium-binding protein [Rhizobium sp.]|nr:calcium-binding protein [Rhizobium sp.]